MDSLDEASHTATMHANGTDKRGQGGAHARRSSRTLREEGDETVVDVVTDFTITGRLARFGRGGMIEDISKRMMRDFSQCLQASLAVRARAGAEARRRPPGRRAAAQAPVTPREEAEAAAGLGRRRRRRGRRPRRGPGCAGAAGAAPGRSRRPPSRSTASGWSSRCCGSAIVRFFARLVGRGEK